MVLFGIVAIVVIRSILRSHKRKPPLLTHARTESERIPIGFIKEDGTVREGPWHPCEIRAKAGFLSLWEKVQWIKHDLEAAARAVAREDVRVDSYGAFEVHPKHLVIWVCVKTDAEKQRLEADENLMLTLREILVQYDYPREGRDSVHIGFESQETVDRESDGEWFYHWK